MEGLDGRETRKAQGATLDVSAASRVALLSGGAGLQASSCLDLQADPLVRVSAQHSVAACMQF